jgi:copper chaperone CopZ
MALQTLRLATSGMHCSSCAMLIDMTLADLDGVETSSTDHADGSTVVTYDDAKTGPDAIIGAIQGAGYDAEVEG